MKYLYTDRYVGNRRSNRVDEFVGNGEIEREREEEVGRDFVRKGREKGKGRIRWLCIYTGRKGWLPDPFKGLSDVSDKIHPSRATQEGGSCFTRRGKFLLARRGAAEQLYRRV